jgi:predicted signal transduction protein with EAL and GGDEF domain
MMSLMAAGAPDHSAELLLRDADLAMYAAKRRHKGGYAFYEPAMHTKALTRLELRSQVRELKAAGCAFAQGYFFAMPLDAGRVTPFALQRARERPPAVAGAASL